MRILLVCAGGMSTSLLAESMKAHADNGDVVDAVGLGSLERVVGGYDVVLVGPQVRHREHQVADVAGRVGVPHGVMDMRAYRMVDGAAMVAQARALLGVR